MESEASSVWKGQYIFSKGGIWARRIVVRRATCSTRRTTRGQVQGVFGRGGEEALGLVVVGAGYRCGEGG